MNYLPLKCNPCTLYQLHAKQNISNHGCIHPKAPKNALENQWLLKVGFLDLNLIHQSRIKKHEWQMFIENNEP